MNQDNFAIPRIELYNESWIKTKSRLMGAMTFAKKMTRQ
jgi:hypothetical protein